MRKEAVVIGMTIAAAAFAITCAAWRLRQVDAGICPRTGVQTSDADLRTGVISSLIGIGAENIRHQNAEHYRDGLGLRVAGPMSDSEIAEALFDLKDGGIGFAEEFGAREVAQVPDEQVGPIREPFVLLNYSTYGGYTATRTRSRDIISVDRSSLPAGADAPGLVNRLRGFGTHYYRIEVRNFIYDCCTYKHGAQGPAPHYWDPGKDGSVIIGSRDLGRVAYVSNCGEILAHRNVRGFSEITWMKGGQRDKGGLAGW